MAEMDIYMRRRLVALGGLVLFFIIFVLLVKSCGGEDEPEPVAQAPTGATGVTGGALTPEMFIEQGDAICGPANLAVSELDPTDTGSTQQEYLITKQELDDLNTLEQAEESQPISKFLNDLGAVAAALRLKAQAVKSGDVAAQDAAQLEIDTAEVDARASGKDAGFADCGQFLDAGEAPSNGGGGGGGTDTGGAVAPTDTGTATTPTTPAPTTPTAPAPTTPTDPGDDTGGGISG
jgi:hypothetical protein